MLQELSQLTDNTVTLKKEFNNYNISGITNIATYSRIQKAFLKVGGNIRTEQQLTDCKIKCFGSLQKLKRLGVDLNDLDCWFVNSYKLKDGGATVEAQYMYQALLRAAAKRGYNIFCTIYHLLPDEKFFTERDERGIIRIHYRNEGLKKDISVDTIEDYNNFFVLLDIRNKGKLIHQEELFISPSEMKKRAKESKASYNSNLGHSDIWEKWTRQMIDKTLVVSAMKILKESIPDLGEVFEFEDMEADNEEIKTTSTKTEEVAKIIHINNINIDNPSETVLKEASEIQQEYANTPELKEFNRNHLRKAYDEIKNEDERKHFFDSNAHIIWSLDPEIRNKIIESAKNKVVKN